ncbi:MAG TPA: hypothetical protein VEY11_20185 [Pyrinomonadaceae bacterium]|nr:hypothetical protein [Pyrinomonadaceae bacterium]
MLRALTAAGVRASACLSIAASLLFIAANVSHVRAEKGAAGVVSPGASPDGRTLIVRLRSFAPRASGRLEVEPTKGGGRVRLTALNMPPPQSLAPDARTFVAWASGGRILRLGELRRGSRGDASLVFSHPSEFARYSLIVTAERDARAERPTGAPVFSTRANEVAALFPAPPPGEDSRAAAATARRERRTVPTPSRRDTDAPPHRRGGTTDTTTATAGTNAPPRPAANAGTPRPAATNNAAAMTPPPAAATTALRIRESARAGGAEGEFFANVDEAIECDAGARTLVLVGDRGARRARGTARVATQPDGTAYVRVRFRRVPKPSRFGRGTRYAMWALNPEELSTTYMGTLPARDINRRQTYARTEGVNSNKFRLLVTAERRAAPAPRPAGRRVLMTFKGRRRKS